MKNEKDRGALQTYDPWKDFFNMENLFPSEWNRSGTRMPAVNISEDDRSYNLDVVAPGFRKEDFKVNVEDDVLTVSAERKSESVDAKTNQQYRRQEYSYSSFSRSFRLPDNAKDDSIEASYKDGILKLSIPKSKQEVKATKEIPIR